jgi:molybdopterin/thiamine biosynthesis adenylyltransferase
LSEIHHPLCPLAERTVLVAGLGNIGSTLPGLLARAGVGQLRLVDRDRVEARNVLAQDYRPADVGRFKAEAQAERLRQQFPDLIVEADAVDLEDLPVERAAVDLLIGALDSRRARQVLIGDLAWPLGIAVVDGGVGDGLLGRVQVFVPGPRSACLECTWGAADYRLAAAEYPCLPGAAATTAPTAAPAFLGTFVASLMASEALRLLEGPLPEESYEIPFDLNHLHLRRYSLRRSSRCRHDHEITREVVSTGRTVAGLLALLEQRFGGEPVRLEARRGMGRFMTPEALRQRPTATLADLGLVSGDRLRARGLAGSIWLSVNIPHP